MSKVKGTKNAALRRGLADEHVTWTRSAFDAQKKQSALMHAELAYEYSDDPCSLAGNDFAYLLISEGQLDRSKQILQSYEDNCVAGSKSGIPSYNLAVIEALQGDLRRALEHFERSVERCANLMSNDRKCHCLYTLHEYEGNLQLGENRADPDLLECARSCIAEIQAVIDIEGKGLISPSTVATPGAT
jgi:hypothetical protein